MELIVDSAGRVLLERLIRKSIRNAIEGRVTHVFLPEENALSSIAWLTDMLHLYGDSLRKVSLNFVQRFSEVNDFLYSLVTDKVTDSAIIILHRPAHAVDPCVFGLTFFLGDLLEQQSNSFVLAIEEPSGGGAGAPGLADLMNYFRF